LNLTRTGKAGLLGSGQAVEFVTRFAVMGLLARHMTKPDYGLYSLVWVVYFFFLPFFYLGLDPAIYYFWPKAGADGRRELIVQSLSLHTLAGLGLALLVFAGAPVLAWCWREPLLVGPLRALSLFALFVLPATASQGILMNADRPILATIMSFVNRAVPSLACAAAIILASASIEATFLYVGAVAGVMLIGAAWISLRQAGPVPMRWRWRRWVEQLRFAVPMGAPAIAATFSQRLGQVIVPLFYTAAAFSDYRNGALELPVFAILTTPAMTVILPEMSAHATERRVDLLINVWHRAIRKTAFIIYPLTVFLLVHAREIILIPFSSEYLSSVPIFMIFLAVLPTQIANFMTPLMLMKRSGVVLVGSIISLTSLAGLSLALIPLMRTFGQQYGLWGAAAAAPLARTIFMSYYIVQIHRCLGVAYSGVLPWRYLGGVAALSIVAAGAALAAKLLHWAPVPQLLIGAVVFALVFGPLALVTKLFPELERERLRKLWRAVRPF
jgi:O-antigen/teichoic acid export membrane protein